jgi:hypothetical protein
MAHSSVVEVYKQGRGSSLCCTCVTPCLVLLLGLPYPYLSYHFLSLYYFPLTPPPQQKGKFRTEELSPKSVIVMKGGTDKFLTCQFKIFTLCLS